VPWLAITLEVEQPGVEALTEALLEAGADSVALEDADAVTPEEHALFAEPGSAGSGAASKGWESSPGWRRTRIVALAAPQADAAALVARAARSAGLAAAPRFRTERVADEDWVRRTQSQFDPLQVTPRLWIVPSWRGEPPDPSAIVVRLDPGLAFGTGHHATTRLALAWLARTLRGGESLLDYGCGSGILAIAAAKLGARRVAATDLDPQALEAAAANARANGVELSVAPPHALPAGDYDLVVANILAQPLIDLEPALAARVRRGGRIALSGVLAAQGPEVRAAYAADFEPGPGAMEEGWVLIEGRRR
jgi:ribosomal protein L11 methyltransferase